MIFFIQQGFPLAIFFYRANPCRIFSNSSAVKSPFFSLTDLAKAPNIFSGSMAFLTSEGMYLRKTCRFSSEFNNNLLPKIKDDNER